MREDWIECKFDDVFFTTSGGTPSRRNENYYIGNIPWIKSGELKSNVITEAEEFISEEAVKNSSAKVFPAGTILLALYGATIGKIAILGIRAATNQAICGIFETPFVFNKYAYYYLVNKKSYLIKQGIGGAQPNISQTILKNLDFSLPPFPEQRAIVKKLESLFSSLDAGVADLKKAQQQLKIYRQAVLKKAFEGELTKYNLSDYLIKIEAGKSFKCKETTPSVDEVGILKISAVTWGEFNELESKTVEDLTKINIKYFVNPGDFLMSRANTLELVGNSVIVNNISRKLMLSDKTLRLKFTSEIIPKYVLYFLSSKDGKGQIMSLSTGNQESMRNISQSGINKIKIPVPQSIEQQKAIVKQIESRLSVCDSIEQNIKESLEKAEALRQSILKKAFEGNLLSALELAECKLAKDYEPAGVLLQRIKAEQNKATAKSSKKKQH